MIELVLTLFTQNTIKKVQNIGIPIALRITKYNVNLSLHECLPLMLTFSHEQMAFSQ